MKCRFLLCCLICLSVCISAPGNATVPGTGGGRLNLTSAEKAWLAAHPVIRVRVSRDYPPFEFYANGRFQGISFDILTLIGTQLGVEFQPTPEMPWKDALESLKRKEGTDLVLMITKDNSRTGFIEFTNNYIAFPQVIITRKDSKFIAGIKDLSGGTVATENGFIQADEIKRDIAAVTVLETSNTTTSLEAVATGKADAYIGNLAVVSYLIEKNRLANLKVAAPSNYPVDDYAMGVRKDWPELARIIEKAVAAIPEEENRKIHQKWLSVRYEHGIRPIDVFKWVVAVSGILVVFIVQLRRMVRKRTVDLKREIEAHKITEQELQSLFMDAPTGIAYLKDRIFIKVNDAMCRLYGYTCDEMTGHSARMLYATDSEFEALEAMYAQALADGPKMLEARTRSKTGQAVDILLGVAPLERGNAAAGFVTTVLDVTDKREALAALKESEQRFQTIFDESPMIMALYDVQSGAYIDVNSRCCEFHGLVRESVIGRRADEVGVVEPEEFLRLFNVFTANGIIEQEEVCCFDKNKARVHLLLSIRTIEITGKKYAVSVSQDITDRKLAEIALKKSEEEYRNIFENAPIGIFQSVPGGRFLSVNSVYAEIFGYATADEMIEEVKDISTQLYANPAQRDSIMQQLETDGHVIVPDLEAKRKDGSRIYADLFMRAVRGDDESIERFEGFFADVTSRKQLMDELVEREERLRLYIKRIPIACILFDKDLCIQNWNPSAERIFGYLEEEVLGRSAYELIIPEQVQSQVSGKLKQLMDDDVDASAINENRTKDGRIILCEWVNTPFRDNKGNLVGMISMAQDITGRKKAEEIMMQSEKMSMIAGMAAGMAHEVNNPLGVITQDIQNLERRFSPTLAGNRKVAEELGLDLALVNEYMEQRSIAEFITNMRSAAKRASAIIGNMLQFSRQSDIGHQELNINEILEQSVKLAANDYDLRKKYDFKNIVITRDFGQDLPTVPISVTEIEQVFINILKNAAQAMFDADIAQPAITLTTRQDGGCIVATITDNGPGMTDDVRLHLFDPFFTTKAVGSGTGLGMSVSYAIITKNHNGSLTVDSKPGQGACFTVRLPLPRPR